MNIGELLKTNREKRGYTVHRLAKLLDIEVQRIMDWEDNRTQPDLTRSLLLSKLYGVSLEDIFCDFNIGAVLTEKARTEFEHERWMNRMAVREY